MAEAAQLKEILSQSGMGRRQDSGPNVRQPRIKKNSEKQKETKTRLSHWVTKRPTSGIVGQKPTQRRTLSDQDLSTHKRMFIQNRQSGRSNYYGSPLGSHSKIPAESRCYSAPPKPAIKQNSGSGKLYSPVARGEDRSVAGRGHHLQPTQAQRHGAFSRFGENKRLTPEDLEKKRFQTIAEYQFMAPGKTFYYCTRENVKQHLRSIYLAHQPGQKPPKSALQTNWPPVCCQERHRPLRRNPLTGATGEFLGDVSSLRTSPMPHGMMELAHKVSKLALVSERTRVHQENSPKRRAANQSHVPPQPSTENPILSAKELQLSSATEGKESKEGQAVEQGFDVTTLPRGSGIKTLQALKAVQELINKGRGASGRDHTVTALKKKPGAGNSQALKNIVGLSFSKDSADTKDTAEDLLNLPQSSNCKDTGVAQDSAIIIPTLDRPLPPDESADMELLPNVHSSSSKLAESPAGEKGQASHPRTGRPSDLSFTSLWEKPSGVLKHCISMEKGRCSTHSLSGTLQGPLDPENEKDAFCSMDSLSVPFQRKCLGTEVLFSLSDDDDDDDDK
ncbi:serine/threonine-protein kinase Nek3 [Platysternon megacephalum]|uniref:Serine/threonine-protein kinase Nek3 n=1 Tax=Platysternon megacephalum TaxID=55544 RepID=A0A4D9ELE7_9SAUR|nr:serine/threonine-protein kinase Nek3 [Platysternon megacephalum]